MNSLNTIRAGAVAAILAGVFIVGHGILTMFDRNPTDLNSLADYLMEVIFGAGYVALLVAFVALLRLRTFEGVQSYGRLGRVGVYTALLGSAFIIVKTSLIVAVGVAFGAKAVMDVLVIIFGLYIVGSSLVMLGPVLLGIATLRARVLPRWFGLALVIVPLALLIIPVISMTLAGYGPYVEGPFWIAIGYGLWSYGRAREPAQPQPAVAG